jgi:hypothetical protein
MWQYMVVGAMIVSALAYVVWRVTTTWRSAACSPGCGSCPGCSAMGPRNPADHSGSRARDAAPHASGTFTGRA